MAERLAGDRYPVRAMLGASEEEYEKWSTGVADIPLQTLRRLTQFIIDRQQREIEQLQAQLEHLRNSPPAR